MKNISNYLSFFLLILIVGFNAWLYFPETKILADPNDNIFQYSLVYRTNWVWENYGCPFSLSCFPNLTDHVVPTWAEGYPLPFYYSHLPQIVIVSSYRMFIGPLASLFRSDFSLYQYYNLTKYLLLVLFPLSIYAALRMVGFSPLLSVLGAFFTAHFSTDGLYGIDPPSFLWRGYGLTSQLYAVFFMPPAIAFTYKAMKNNNNLKAGDARNDIAGGMGGRAPDNLHPHNAGDVREGSQSKLHLAHTQTGVLKRRFGIPERQDPLRTFSHYSVWATVFLILTTAGHLGIGIIALLSTLPFLFLDLKKNHIRERIKKMFIIYCGVIFFMAYWIIPVLLYGNYHMISFWDPIWKFNSYGWYEVVRQFLAGEIFDWQRWPVVTGIILVGIFAAITDSFLFPFALLFIFWILMYFGSTTWGGLLYLIPGMKDFHQHRFIVGVQIAGIFLIPAGMNWLSNFIKSMLSNLTHLNRKKDDQVGKNPEDRIGNGWHESVSPKTGFPFKGMVSGLTSDRTPGEISSGVKLLSNIILIFLIIIAAYLTVQQTLNYAKFNNLWISQANTAYLYDSKNFENLLAYLNTLPKGRVYAGRPGNWGKSLRLGSTQLYMLLGITGNDMSQFLPETWSPLSEDEQNFDERTADDYDLLNIRYIVASKNEGFTPKAKLLNTFGPFQLFEVPTTGWFDVVTSPMFVTADRTNFINIVHVWERSYSKLWKMYPIISIDSHPVFPDGMRRNLTMSDEANYTENGIRKNIFADFPFVFPPATPSGEIKSEKIYKQTYSAGVTVPQDCRFCTVMFKMSYHPDWTAEVDGLPSKTFAVFPFYLAVSVPPGNHMVSFTYKPNSLKVFLITLEFIITVIGVGYFIQKYLKHHKKSG